MTLWSLAQTAQHLTESLLPLGGKSFTFTGVRIGHCTLLFPHRTLKLVGAPFDLDCDSLMSSAILVRAERDV